MRERGPTTTRSPNETPLVDSDHGSAVPSWAMMRSSPAPIFVVKRDMRVSLWSPGMTSAAPLPIHPVGHHLSELPFVSERSGKKLYSVIGEMFDTPESADQNNPQRIMLYLHAKSGAVLLEMAAHVAGTGSSMVIVMTGRQVESDLGGLIADEQSNSNYVSNYGSGDSHSEGNAGGYGGYECESEVSSLTAPSLISRATRDSEVSSLTAPSLITRATRDSEVSSLTAPSLISRAVIRSGRREGVARLAYE